MLFRSVVAKVSRKNYVRLIEDMGVSMALNPLDMTSASILRFIYGEKRIIFSQLIQGQAEFIEIVAEKHMAMLDTPISELSLPDGVIIAAIHREDDSIIPRGSDEIKVGDRVTLLYLLSDIAEMERFFQSKKWSLR